MDLLIYLNGNITVGSSNDSRDGEWNLVLDGPGAVRADEARILHLGEGGSDKIKGLLQRVCVFRAGVKDVGSQLEPRKDAVAGVNLIKCQQHGLQSLDPPLSIDLPTVLCALTLLVHREQAANHQISVQSDLPLGVSVITHSRQTLGSMGKERHTEAQQAEVGQPEGSGHRAHPRHRGFPQ